MKGEKPKNSEIETANWIKLYIKTGNTQYFGLIFEKYKKQIFIHCLKMLDNVEDAKDLTSDTFIKAIENIQRYDLKRSFSPWLHQIANNLCIDLIRRKALIKFNQMDEKGETQSTENIEKNVENRELCESILNAIRSLKSHQKRCFCLFYIHRKSYKEIVEFTGYSYSNVRSYIQNGKRKFKLAMQR